nr:cystatin [Aristotelia chilensis]
MVKPLVILSVCLIVSICFCGVEGFGSIVGGRTEVKDVKTNEEVQELGRFSVEEFNRNQIHRMSSNGGQLLMFSQVIEAQKQVVSGIKYFLKIQAMKNGQTRLFDSVVVVKPWIHNSKELLHFAPSTD